MRPLLIGLAGKARVGKDTAADYICSFPGFERYAFAAPIKDALAAMGLSRKLYDTDEQKEAAIPGLGVSYRHLAQTLGTEWGRAMHPDFWLILGKMAYSRCKREGARGMVISDVRFENEAQWIRSEGLLIHIDGPARGELKGNTTKHASEGGVSRLLEDVIVLNTSDQKFLRAQLRTITDYELARREER